MTTNNNLIFALDIGTRTIIGLIIKPLSSGYEIIDSEIIEHENRAMLDGQIHNVREVARQVKIVKNKLEERQDFSLKKVALAAAGRALKTVKKEYAMEFSVSKNINEEDVQRLELSTVQEAQRELAQQDSQKSPEDYHFVGYSVIEYQLEDMFIGDLIGQKGKNIKVELIATFLPRVVIDSLLNVINKVGLEVEYLTLEPIAASSVVVPRQMYNFNLALLDIGAGTSDIAVTKQGSMIGYGMVPEAGDEITEALAEEYLLDYNTAERLKRRLFKSDTKLQVKNILGQNIEIEKDKVMELIEPFVENIAQLISKKILEINQKSPQALICIGGGSLTPFLKEKISKFLEMDEERVGIKGIENLEKIKGEIEGINEVQSVTPVGIGKVSYQSDTRAVFMRVQVNGNSLQIFSLEPPTIADALLTANIDIKQLQPYPGRGITCTVNGEIKSFKGSFGEPGEVLLNGEKAELEDFIESGDKIDFEPGKKGEDAQPLIKDILPENFSSEKEIKINGNSVEIDPQIYQNGKPVAPDVPIEDGAEIEYESYSFIGEIIEEVLGIPKSDFKKEVIEFKFNGEEMVINRSKYLIKDKKKQEFLDWNHPPEENLEIEVFANENSEGTIKTLLENRDQLKINIVFNGSELEIPVKNYEIYCNEEAVDMDYKIKPGDQITYNFEPVKIKDVLEYINYDISEKMKDKVNILVNGEISNLHTEIKNADKLEIKYKTNS